MKKHPISEINVVPYIDVMLVLLIIFMVTTPLLTSQVPIELPRLQAKKISHQQSELPMVITVDKAQKYYLSLGAHPERPVMAKALGQRVLAELAVRHDKQVLVRGDRRVSYGAVMEVMRILQHAGVSHVALVTQTSH